MQWHSESIQACLQRLDSTATGLQTETVKARQQAQGANELSTVTSVSRYELIINQFNNVLIYILLVATLLMLWLEHWVDASVIIAVVLMNAVIGYVQESKAERAIEALRDLLSPHATVLRDGERKVVDARTLVTGDIVLFAAGDKVPADLRLMESHSLQIDESIITGESLPVPKQTECVKETSALSEQSNCAFSGTLVTYGQGLGVVVAIGEQTEIGRISSLLDAEKTFNTPLMRQLAKFGRKLALAICTFSAFIFIFGIYVREYPLNEMFMSSVAIAVSVIPEGLPAIITIILALGVTYMARRNVIVRRLGSVETLSSVSVICTDKTGTLTRNELTAQVILSRDKRYAVSGSGYNDQGEISCEDMTVQLDQDSDLQEILTAGCLCNDASLYQEADAWRLSGNPLDGAFITLGLKAALHREQLETLEPRLDCIAFSSEHKYMATLNRHDDAHHRLVIKGAPEVVVSMLPHAEQAVWKAKIDDLAANGMRVIAIAQKITSNQVVTLDQNHLPQDFAMLAIIGIIDPPRRSAAEAVKQCQQAGIRVKMVTGDHALTASAIAAQVGIDTSRVVLGHEIDRMSDQELVTTLQSCDVFARTVPEHKIRIIRALQQLDQTIAMTGDGVNDAPALKQSDIGIAMGIRGTDVAKEAAEMVLMDDKFRSIRDAVEESRNVYNKLKKVILFVLPNDGGEGFLIFFAILFGYTLPITPLQILWVNLVTAVTLALALAFDKPEEGLMDQPPRRRDERLLSGFLLWRISFVSILYVICMFGLFLYETHRGTPIDVVRSMVVNLLVFMEAAYVFNCRHIYDSVLNRKGLLESQSIWVAIVIVTVLQMVFTYWGAAQSIFQTAALSLTQWVVILAIVVISFIVIELEKASLKYFRRDPLGPHATQALGR